MFEKEAEEYLKKDGTETEQMLNNITLSLTSRQAFVLKNAFKQTFKDGAEFGYNKANEWHYMKDVNCYEDLHFPPEEDCKGRICIWKVKDCSENYHCGSYDDLWYEINAYHVIAWKEIVLPELKESR